MTYALTGPELRASDNIMRDFGGIELTTDEVKAYDAPFPEEIYMTGIRTLPSMASMLDIEASLAAWEALKRYNRPFLTIFGQYDMLVGSEKIQPRPNPWSLAWWQVSAAMAIASVYRPSAAKCALMRPIMAIAW